MSSVNHYSRDAHHTLLWQHRHNDGPPLPETAETWWRNQNDAAAQNDRSNDHDQDHNHRHKLVFLFEKSLTPSDVGKLNRLVIPKQYAEKYFPLNGSSSSSDGGGDSAEKGMLLSFEDESGKSWRFRYSYWNSSQSYVLTKGWSRYVKEKQLDAGDVVFFQRYRSDARQLFIGCRKRGEASSEGNMNTTSFSSGMATSTPYRQPHHQVHRSSYAHSGTATAAASAAVMGTSSRTVRLFGVNLECQLDDDDTSAATASGEPPYHDVYGHSHHLNLCLSEDIMKQMEDRQG